MKVVGIKDVTAKKDGSKFTELHLISEDRFVRGFCALTVFVRNDQIMNYELLDLDSEVQVLYNRFGRVDSVVVAPVSVID